MATDKLYLKAARNDFLLTFPVRAFYNVFSLILLFVYFYLVFGEAFIQEYAFVGGVTIFLAVFTGISLTNWLSFRVFLFLKRGGYDWLAGYQESVGEKKASQKLERIRRDAINLPFLLAVSEFTVWVVVGAAITWWVISVNPDQAMRIAIHMGLSAFYTSHLVAMSVYYSTEAVISRNLVPYVLDQQKVSQIAGVIPVPVYFKLTLLVLTTAIWPIVFISILYFLGEASGSILLFVLLVTIVDALWQGGMILYSVSRPIGLIAEKFDQLRVGKSLEDSPMIHRADALGRFSEMFDDLVASMSERDFIRGTFSRYVSQQVVDQILSGKVELGGIRMNATVMFADIRSFTSMSETMEPEEIVEFLNEYLERMVQAITYYEGVPDKFIGDGIMAVWGVPVSQDEHSLLAVQSSLAMLDALKQYNHVRVSENKPEIQIGIGLHSGELVAGNIGSRRKMEFTVIGDTVNTCSRIEGMCKELGSMLTISASVYSELPGSMQDRFSYAGEIGLRGKSRALSLYTLIE